MKTHQYEISGTTTAFLNCYAMCNELESAIGKAIETRYAGEALDKVFEPICELISQIDEKLLAEIGKAVAENMSDTANTSSETIKI